MNDSDYLLELAAKYEKNTPDCKEVREHVQRLRDMAKRLSPAKWVCFHCDERFTDEAKALLHFGSTEYQKPGCQIPLEEYRAMEQRLVAYASEDTALHREMEGKLAEHQLALVRAEERGYSRGLQDAHGVCETCHGSGQVKAMTRHLGPDDYGVEVTCGTCGGTGDRKTPLDMVLFCPECNTQHIDHPEPGWPFPPRKQAWDNPPHRSHLCGACGHQWRPADVPTNGVQSVRTKGRDDSPLAKGNPWRVGQFVINANAAQHGPARIDKLRLFYGFEYTLATPHNMGPRYGTINGGINYNHEYWKTYHAVPPQR